jgi:hypothetical protein
MQHATLQCMPGELREACLKVPPPPETLPAFHTPIHGIPVLVGVDFPITEVAHHG